LSGIILNYIKRTLTLKCSNSLVSEKINVHVLLKKNRLEFIIFSQCHNLDTLDLE